MNYIGFWAKYKAAGESHIPSERSSMIFPPNRIADLEIKCTNKILVPPKVMVQPGFAPPGNTSSYMLVLAIDFVTSLQLLLSFRLLL